MSCNGKLLTLPTSLDHESAHTLNLHKGFIMMYRLNHIDAHVRYREQKNVSIHQSVYTSLIQQFH